MRILFIRDDYVLWYSVGIMYLSGMLKAEGHDTRLAFSSHPGFLDEVQRYNPDVLAYTVSTGMHRKYLAVNRRIKRELPGLGAFSVFGGPHATFYPEMIEAEGVDAICRGEGEIAFAEFVKRLEGHGGHSQTPGFWVKTASGIVRNDVGELVTDLDTLPFPDHALVYDADPLTDRVSAKSFAPIRGCPYGCTYCFNHSMQKLYRGKGPWVRHHSVEYVLKDMERVKAERPMKFVRFVSDTFNLSVEWLEEFSEKYPKRVGVPFHANVRADRIDEATARLLAEAGCAFVSMGVESGEDKRRIQLLKRNEESEQILRAVRLLQNHGVHVVTQNMLGLPGEVFQDTLESLRLATQCSPDYAWAAIYTPYPRTELAEYAAGHGYCDGNSDVALEDFYTRSIMRFRSALDKRRIENLHKLFGIMAEMPGLQPVVGFLSVLPLSWAYSALHTLWWGYTQHWRLMPYEIGSVDLLKTIHRFVRKCRE